jgi:exopolysaccharide biosynthesis polyprenyl glycosylphosphotransferase
MHDVAATAERGAGLLTGTALRVLLRRAGATLDLVAALAATLAAIALRSPVASLLGLNAQPAALEWPLVIPFFAMLAVFYSEGLYERDAYMSRPLHAWTVTRAAGHAFVIAAAASFLAGPAWFNVSRLILVLTFVIFVPLDLAVRLGILDRVYVAWVRRSRPIGFVVGGSPVAVAFAEHLSQLHGFDSVRGVEASGLERARATAIADVLDSQPSRCLASDAVFVDGSSLSPRAVLDIVEAAQSRGVDAYVISGLLGPLEGNRLLNVLFQAPVTRVRGSLLEPPAYGLKRVLDVVGSAIVLLLLSPVVAVLAAIIKFTSPGPVFLAQTRVGRSGETFEFLKFRSMYVNSDSRSHEEYVHALINGVAEPTATDADGNGVFKIVDDPRVTPIGRIIRKFSLDEIPQLWNVLRGDMSLVGPRPPLPYEVREYDDWQRQRLEVQSGITGVWQVVGRNRVSFDEMTFQDLMYGMNRGLWLDIRLCLRTIPAALLGSGL